MAVAHIGLQIAAQAGTTPTTTSEGDTLTHDQGLWALWLTVVLVIAAGVVIALGRGWLEGRAADRGKRKTGRQKGDQTGAAEEGGGDRTLIRSWLAISLVGGMLLFTALSFWLDDTTLRSTLVGGVVASAGAAVAFYFASKSSDQARQDILGAVFPSVLVPNLENMDETAANAALARISLRLDAQPPKRKEGAQVVSQEPPAFKSVPQGSVVRANFLGPVPDLKDMTRSDADAALKENGLSLVPSPLDAARNAKVSEQDPPAGAKVPPDGKVKVTF